MTNTCNIYLGIEPKNKKREKRYGKVKRRIENPVKHLRERELFAKIVKGFQLFWSSELNGMGF